MLVWFQHGQIYHYYEPWRSVRSHEARWDPICGDLDTEESDWLQLDTGEIYCGKCLKKAGEN